MFIQIQYRFMELCQIKNINNYTLLTSTRRHKRKMYYYKTIIQKCI